MIFCSANYITPINKLKTDFRIDNNVKKSETAFNTHIPKVSKNKEKSYVSSDLVISFLGINNKNNNKIKPLTMEELSQYKNSMGAERFDNKEKQDLITLSYSCPLIRNLIKLETTQGKPRFGFKDINYLADIHEVHPEAITDLALIETSQHEPRFNAYDIDELFLSYEFSPNEITALAKIETQYNEPRFTNYDIMNLTDAYSNYPEEVQELAKIKSFNGVPKFKGYEISSLAYIYKGHRIAINELAQILTAEGEERFDGEDIEDIVESYEKNPKAVKELAEIEGSNNIFRFDGQDIRILLPIHEKYPKSVKELADMRTSKDCFRFSSNEISELSELYEKYPNVITSLANSETDKHRSKYSVKEIKRIADLCNNKDLEKIISENTDKIKSCTSVSSDNFIELEIDEKILHIQADNNGGYKILGEEKQGNRLDIKTTELKMSDNSVKYEEYSKKWTDEFQGYLETIKDNDGHVISRTLTKPSKRNPGVLIVLKEILDKDGNLVEIQELGTVKNYEKKGEPKRIRINRNFTSPLGVKSEQLVLEVPRGKRSKYTIGDKSFERVFKVKDENTTETYAWGNKYETKFNKDNIEITVTKKDKSVKKAYLGKSQIDFNFVPLLKQIPGDFLYTLTQTKTRLDIDNEEDSASFYRLSNKIAMSKEFANNPFTFAHEYGHLLDDVVLNDLHNDKNLKEIFDKELDAYKKNASSLNEEQIMYFVAKNHKNRGGCLTEVIAETTAILSGLKHDRNHILLRAKILQENFPETMVYIGSKIEEAM